MKPAVLILGATGTIGSGVVRAAIEADWPVVAVARDRQSLDELRARHPDARLRTIVGSVADDASATALVSELRKLTRPFAGVVAALGTGSERGRLLDHPSERLRETFDDAVIPHLVAARHLLPWLAESGRNCGYVVVGGPGSRNPWAGYGHRSIAAAAVNMLARVLHGEALAYAVRLQLLEVESPVRTNDNEKHACKQWPCVDHIGRKALALLKHRNDARCTEAVVDYRSDACISSEAGLDEGTQSRAGTPPFFEGDVESASPRSSSSKMDESEDLTLKQLQAPESTTSHGLAPQEMDSDASLLPSRCLQDVRKLLDNFTSIASPKASKNTNPTKKNQERTK
jgi:NAD(P)-dependent dehydrogenase (short-subunit alcohol dehydrogenase family)